MAILSLFGAIFGWWREKNSEKKKQKREALNVVLEGLEKDDPSLVTIGFSRMR